MPKIIENKLIEEFKNRESFSIEDLFEFFQSFESNLKEGTFGWRIYDLRKKNIIKSVGRGVYTISDKPKYVPKISSDIVKLAKKITQQFDDIKYCIWNTGWLNEFSQHQAIRHITLIEVEKDLAESVFYELTDHFKYDIFLNPDEATMNLYVSESAQPVVIKKLITRSPIGKRTEKKVKIYVPLLEKMLVDIFSEEKLFYFYQGVELAYIYQNAIDNYSINFTKLRSYAKRRKKVNEIDSFMTTHIPNFLTDIVDD